VPNLVQRIGVDPMMSPLCELFFLWLDFFATMMMLLVQHLQNFALKMDWREMSIVDFAAIRAICDCVFPSRLRIELIHCGFQWLPLGRHSRLEPFGIPSPGPFAYQNRVDVLFVLVVVRHLEWHPRAWPVIVSKDGVDMQMGMMRTARSKVCERWTNHTMPTAPKDVAANVSFEAVDMMNESIATEDVWIKEGLMLQNSIQIQELFCNRSWSRLRELGSFLVWSLGILRWGHPTRSRTDCEVHIDNKRQDIETP